MAKQYTVMVIPDITGTPRTFNISGVLVRAIIFVSVCLVVGSVYFGYRHVKLSKDVVELAELRQETVEQRKKIKEFSYTVKKFESVISRLAQFDKKLRVITSLEGTGQDMADYAIGGSRDALIPPPLENGSEMMSFLGNEMGRLNARASNQNISFQELDVFFREQTSLLSSTPSIWPIKGWVTSGFGYRRSPFTGRKEMHEGIDVATRLGSPILAPAEGIVVRAGKVHNYGNLIEIDHGYGVLTKYGHIQELLVSVGEQVKRGQKIATVGNTGRSTGPHLHYEVVLHGIPVNPFQYILDEG